MSWLLVALGGAAGVLCRAWVVSLVPAAPLAGVLAVNLVGALALGVLHGLLDAVGTPEGRRLRLALGTGFLGGLTTHSTFVLQSQELAAGGRPALALAHLLGSMVLGVLLAVAGLGAGGVLGRRWAAARGRAGAGSGAPRDLGAAS